MAVRRGVDRVAGGVLQGDLLAPDPDGPAPVAAARVKRRQVARRRVGPGETHPAHTLLVEVKGYRLPVVRVVHDGEEPCAGRTLAGHRPVDVHRAGEDG